MRRPLISGALACAAAAFVLLAGAARADEAALTAKVEALEERVRELEAIGDDVGGSGGSEWTRRVRLSGSALTGYFGGKDNSVTPDNSFSVWDARFFIDAELGRDVRVGSKRVLRDVGFSFEWDLMRLGRLENTVGDLYAEFQGILDSDWLNLQVGRFQIPVGENYLRFGRGYRDNPFLSNSVGGPWFWDEGIRFYGGAPDGRFGVVASITDGETPLNADFSDAPQFTLKVFTQPFPWLHLSMSTLRSGEIGSPLSPAQGALWLGESWARAFGSGSSIPNYVGGLAVPDGPRELEGTFLLAGDVILTWSEHARLWLSYGNYDIDSTGPSLYDRTLHYWIGELVLEGGMLAPEFGRTYVALRANGLGTYNHDEGYVLDSRYARTLGYNMESLTAYSIGLGWEITRFVDLRAEYVFTRIDLVDGVSDTIRAAARHANSFGIAVGAAF